MFVRGEGVCVCVCVCVWGLAASAPAPMTSPEFKVGRASPSEVEERGEREAAAAGSSHSHLTAARSLLCRSANSANYLLQTHLSVVPFSFTFPSFFSFLFFSFFFLVSHADIKDGRWKLNCAFSERGANFASQVLSLCRVSSDCIFCA